MHSDIKLSYNPGAFDYIKFDKLSWPQSFVEFWLIYRDLHWGLPLRYYKLQV